MFLLKAYTHLSLDIFYFTFSLMLPLFQKYLDPQVRTKMINSVVYHPCPAICGIVLKVTSFHISLNSLGFYFSRGCLLNFL